MNAPHLHPPAEILLAYALGQSSEAVSLAVACHLSFCGACSAAVAAHERTAGAALDALPAAPVGDDAIARLLASLDATPADVPAAPTVSPQLAALERELAPLPGPLVRSLAQTPDLRWRRLVPGVKAIDVPTRTTGAVARLVRFRPGFVIPLHDHEAPEYTLIVSGELHERDEVARRGDLVTRDPGDQHVQTIGAVEECVALVVNEGPLVPLTWLGRLLKRVGGV